MRPLWLRGTRRWGTRGPCPAISRAAYVCGLTTRLAPTVPSRPAGDRRHSPHDEPPPVTADIDDVRLDNQIVG